MAEQNLITFEKALKDNYLPVWRNLINTEASPLLAKLKKPMLVANEIVASAPIGLSGGFGFGEEGQATPDAGNVMFERFKTTAKDMYTKIELSVKAVRLTGNKGAMANALDTEVKAAYETAKWNVGRALFGNGSGKLATVKAQTSASKTVEVTDVKYIKEGLVVDFYPTNAATVANATVRGARIVAVNRVKNTSGNYEITLQTTPSTAISAGFLTVQNSFNRELTGLGAIFDSSVTSLYGITKSDNPFIQPIEIDANDNIDDSIITRALRRAKNEKNSKVDMILCGDDAYDEYVAYLRSNNIRVEENTHELQGGFKAIKFLFEDRIVDIVNESFVPEGEAWGIDSSALEFHSQDWDFANLQGGGVFNLREGSSVYRALLANYGNLICSNPGGCVRI